MSKKSTSKKTRKGVSRARVKTPLERARDIAKEALKDLSVIHRPATNLRWCERTLCDTFQDMRDTIGVLKGIDQYPEAAVHTLASLVEEAQVYASRMEAALSDYKTWVSMKEEYKAMKAEVKLYNEFLESKGLETPKKRKGAFDLND